MVDDLDIFNFFSARGGGRGSPRRQEGKGRFLLKIAGRGGGFPGGGGAERLGGCLQRIREWRGGGGLNFFFFSGPKRPPRISLQVGQECTIQRSHACIAGLAAIPGQSGMEFHKGTCSWRIHV